MKNTFIDLVLDIIAKLILLTIDILYLFFEKIDLIKTKLSKKEYIDYKFNSKYEKETRLI